MGEPAEWSPGHRGQAVGQTEGWGCRQKKVCGQQTQCDSLWLWAIPAGGLHTDPCLRHTWADLARCPLPGRAGRGQLQLPAAPWQPGWSKTQVPLALRRDRLEEGRERFLLSPNRPLSCFISASDPHSGRNSLCPACPTTGVTPEVYRLRLGRENGHLGSDHLCPRACR